MWTTSRFREENPKIYSVVIAALRDAVTTSAAIAGRRRDLHQGGEFEIAARLLTGVLGEPDLAFDVAPQHSLDLARFPRPHRLLKSPPRSGRNISSPRSTAKTQLTG